MTASQAIREPGGVVVDVRVVAPRAKAKAEPARPRARLGRIVRRLWSRDGADVAKAEPEEASADADDVAIIEQAYADHEPDKAWLQALWGPGFLTPGSEDYVLASVKALKLSSSVSLLELEPGLGGSTRAIAKESGCWVTGVESNEMLAIEAQDLSKRAGFAKKAEIRPFDPASPGFKAKAYDHCFAKDGLLDVADKPSLYAAVHKALKKGGQFVFSEFVGRKDANVEEAIVALGKSHAAPRGLWTKDDLLAALGKAGFTVKHAETTSPVIEREVVRAWLAMSETLRTEPLPANKAAMIVNECTRWVRISALLREGVLEHLSVRAERV
jgi:SAM-dependent methyltransferase